MQPLHHVHFHSKMVLAFIFSSDVSTKLTVISVEKGKIEVATDVVTEFVLRSSSNSISCSKIFPVVCTFIRFICYDNISASSSVEYNLQNICRDKKFFAPRPIAYYSKL